MDGYAKTWMIRLWLEDPQVPHPPMFRRAVLNPEVGARMIRDGFPGGLLCTDAGFFPGFKGHQVERRQGTEGVVIMINLSGYGWVSWPPGPRMVVEAGAAVVLFPGQAHAYGADPDDPWTIAWLHAAGPALDGLLPELGGAGVRPCPDPTVASAACDRAWRFLSAGQDPVNVLRASGAAWEVVLSLVADQRQTAQPTIAVDGRVHAAERLMRQNIGRSLTVLAMANVAGCSPSHLTLLFRRHRHCSPLDRFLRLKMEEAAHLLAITNLPVAEIARHLGYADPFYFSRRFRSVCRTSPVGWREMVRR